MTERSIAAVALLLLALDPSGARAGVDSCRKAVARASAKYFQTIVQAGDQCERAVVASGAGSCPDGAMTTALAKAATKLDTAIAKACGGRDRLCNGDVVDEVPPAAIGWPAACPNLATEPCDGAIATCGDVTSCLQCLGTAAADANRDLAYRSLVLPSTGDSTLNACQRAIGKAGADYLRAASKALARCWLARLAGAHSDACAPPAIGDGKYLGALAKADAKRTTAIAKACGGSDHVLGGGDDLAPAAIGFPNACPDVAVPAGPACGGPVTDLAGIVACTDCLADATIACVDRAAIPAASAYPAECGACFSPAATGPCPATLALTIGERADVDLGWTGLAHDVALPSASGVTFAVDGCSGGTQPACGACTVTGPVADAGGPSANRRRCRARSWIACDDDADCGTCNGGASHGAPCGGASECPGGACDASPCVFFLGAPQPLLAGFPFCLLNEIAAPMTGTVDFGDGTVATSLLLRPRVYGGQSLQFPCPVCIGGTCAAGAREGEPCVVDGSGPLGDVSLDCPPSGSEAATLTLDLALSTATQSRTVTATSPACRQTGWTTFQCLCDTCNDVNATPCTANADCPPSGGNPGICGGRRCVGGPNAGAPCVASSECPGAGCNRPGEPSQISGCHGDVTAPSGVPLCAPTGDGEGECAAGPVDTRCSTDVFVSCLNDADCLPTTAGGSCEQCTAANQHCIVRNRPCFTDQGVPGTSTHVVGRPSIPCGGLARPTLGALTCVAPVTPTLVNTTLGLPGLARMRLPATIVP